MNVLEWLNLKKLECNFSRLMDALGIETELHKKTKSPKKVITLFAKADVVDFFPKKKSKIATHQILNFFRVIDLEKLIFKTKNGEISYKIGGKPGLTFKEEFCFFYQLFKFIEEKEDQWYGLSIKTQIFEFKLLAAKIKIDKYQ